MSLNYEGSYLFACLLFANVVDKISFCSLINNFMITTEYAFIFIDSFLFHKLNNIFSSRLSILFGCLFIIGFSKQGFSV